MWEEERQALKQVLHAAGRPSARPPSRGAGDTSDQTRAHLGELRCLAGSGGGEEELQQVVALLRSRLQAMERENAEAGKRAAHLELHLRERERLLVKADKRYQELKRCVCVGGG